METSKRARKRKLDIAKTDLEPLLAVVLRQNSESTELHFLTMLQPCSQAVDLKVDRHFGEGVGATIFYTSAFKSDGRPCNCCARQARVIIMRRMSDVKSLYR
jgi:hypothetical protein